MADPIVKNAEDVKLIVLACEAGAGSSLMVAKQVQKMLKKAKLEVAVVHKPVTQIKDADVVLVHQSLAAQAKRSAPDAAIVPFFTFINDPKVKGLVENLKNGQPITSEL